MAYWLSCLWAALSIRFLSALRLASREDFLPRYEPSEQERAEHPKFAPPNADKWVNECNRHSEYLCHPKVKDSGGDAACNAHFFQAVNQLKPLGEVLIFGGGADEFGANTALKTRDGVHFKQGPQFSIELRQKYRSSSYDTVFFNYHLHHAADDTIPFLTEASRIARSYIIVAEDIKTLDPKSWKLEFEDDVVGTHRGDEEWKAMFKLMGLEIVLELEPSCMEKEHAVPRKLYVLKPPEIHPGHVRLGREAEAELFEDDTEGPKVPFGEVWDCVQQDFFRWLDKSGVAKKDMQVLDVGGGRARLELALHGKLKTVHSNPELKNYQNVRYECVDFNPTVACPRFNGRNLTVFDDASFHSVMFHSTLHHAADTTIPLLLDAKRVAQQYVIVSEDMKARKDASYHLQWTQHHHDPHGTYRGDREWKALFKLVGLKLIYESGPRMCGDNMDVGRRLYILKV